MSFHNALHMHAQFDRNFFSSLHLLKTKVNSISPYEIKWKNKETFKFFVVVFFLRLLLLVFF